MAVNIYARIYMSSNFFDLLYNINGQGQCFKHSSDKLNE